MKVVNNSLVLDANETQVFQRQLELVKTRMFDKKYPQFKFRQLFPISVEGGGAIESITFYVYDQVAAARLIGSYGQGISRSDISGTSVTIPCRRAANMFGMTLDEIKGAAMTGRPVSSMKASAAREGHEALLNAIAWFGDAAAGLIGLFSHPNIPSGAAPLGGWLSGEADVTPDTICADIYDGYNAIVETTNEIEKPNRLILPIGEYNYIHQKRMSTQTSETIASYIKSTSDWLTGGIFSAAECKLVASLAGIPVNPPANVAVYYNYDADKFQMEIPEDVNALAPQLKDLEETTILTCKTAGLNVYYPMSVYIQTLTYAGGEG